MSHFCTYLQFFLMFFVFEETLIFIRFRLQFALLHIFTTLFTDKANGFSIFFDHQRSQIYKKDPSTDTPENPKNSYRCCYYIFFLNFFIKRWFSGLPASMPFSGTSDRTPSGAWNLIRFRLQFALLHIFATICNVFCLRRDFNFDYISSPFRTFAHIYNSF
jgi:hypothetical protein